jgi:hypothetical protein
MHNLGERFVSREKQFLKIIWEMNDRFANCENVPKEVSETFNKLLSGFDAFIQTTKQFMEKRYNESLKEMHYKISNILLVVDEEIGKLKKSPTTPNMFVVRREIEQLLEMAETIEEDNVRVRQKLKEEIAKNHLLVDDKNVLLA